MRTDRSLGGPLFTYATKAPRDLGPSRGVVLGVLIGLAIWAGIGLLIWRLA